MKIIDESKFTHFLYENYDNKVAELVDELFGRCFGTSESVSFRVKEIPSNKLDECINDFFKSNPELGDKVIMLFDN